MNRDGFDDGADGFMKVNIGTLMKTISNQTSFVSSYRAVGITLDVKDPLVTDEIDIGRKGNEFIGFFVENIIELREKGINPVRSIFTVVTPEGRYEGWSNMMP